PTEVFTMWNKFLTTFLTKTAAPRRQGRPARPRRMRLESLENRLALSGSTAVLPISAFLAQQGHNTSFTPPVPDQLAWTDSAYDAGNTGNPNLELLADYTGQAA